MPLLTICAFAAVSFIAHPLLATKAHHRHFFKARASLLRLSIDDGGAIAEKLTALSLPSEPSPDLTPQDVVRCLCMGLKFANVPNVGDGLRRVYHFTTYECRAALTSRKGYKSGPERFVKFAEMWALPGCVSFQLVSEPTIIPGTQTRGAMASVAVDVVETLAFRHKSGFERVGSADESVGPGEEANEPSTRTERYLFTLQQERRPPLTGCWMVTTLMPCAAADLTKPVSHLCGSAVI